MSRGLGRVQKQIADLFAKYPDGTLDTFVAAVVVYQVQVGADGMRYVTDAQLSAVRRALNGLAKAGKVKRRGRGDHGREDWCLASATTGTRVTIRQVAAAVGVSKSTLWRALRERRANTAASPTVDASAGMA